MITQSNKILIIIITLGLTFSILYSLFNLKNFDKNQDFNNHLMIRGDISFIWQESHEFKEDLLRDHKIIGAGKEYIRTFLPSKILSIFYLIFDEKFYQDYEKKVVSIGGKFKFLFFQIIIFYSSLIFFYRNLAKYYKDENLSLFTVGFLALDPNIVQWHSTFWTESIFFSLQLILLSQIIKERKSYLNFFIIGILLGITFLQKTVAIFLIFFVFTYLIFNEKEKKILKNLTLVVGFFMVLIFLAFDNFKKTGIAYIMPTQTKSAHYVYIAQRIIKQNEGSIERLKIEEERWKKENRYDADDFKSNYEYFNFIQDQAIRVMMDNKIETIKIYIRNSLSHIILNPLQTYYWHKYNDKFYKNQEFHLSEEAKKYFYFKFSYSIIIYSIIILGFFKILTNRFKIDFHLFILALVFYFIFMLGWVGNSRYFMPSLIFLSVFFGNGLVQLKKTFSKINYNK
tara:strand:+ start:104 stop:1468 length:1365 start_codon:yes stop_codon:yes gene_type:complete